MNKAIFLALLITYAFAQNCTSIYASGNRQYKNSFAVSSLPMVVNAIPSTACANNGYILEATCVYEEHFSCLVFNRATGAFDAIDCREAERNKDFPLCYGQVQFYADCSTIECCTALNDAALPYAKQQFGPLGDVSYYYWMQFYSTGGAEVSCSTSGPTYCVQNLNFYGSSNWNTCNTLYENFRNADDMAFNLF